MIHNLRVAKYNYFTAVFSSESIRVSIKNYYNWGTKKCITEELVVTITIKM